MNASKILRIALIAVIAVGLPLVAAGSASAYVADASTATNAAAQQAGGDDIDFEFEGGELEVDSDGNVDLETPEGVELEISSDGSWELDGNGVDQEGENDADIEVTTNDDEEVEFEFSDGELEDFEVGDTELELGGGQVELETPTVDFEQDVPTNSSS